MIFLLVPQLSFVLVSRGLHNFPTQILHNSLSEELCYEYNSCVHQTKPLSFVHPNKHKTLSASGKYLMTVFTTLNGPK